MATHIIPGKWTTPTTVDLPAAGSVAGSLDIAIAVKSVEVIHLRVSVPFKWAFAEDADAAVIAFATAANHGRLPAGTGSLTALGQTAGDSLYLEAELAGAVTTNGVTHWTEAHV